MSKKPGLRMLPYEGSPQFKKLASRGAKISGQRNMSMFLLRRIKNYLLGLVAYFSPINSVRVLCHRRRGVKIGKNVLIGLHCVFDHSFPEYIIIEDNVSLGGDVYLLTHSCPPEHFKGKLMSYVAPIHIHEGAWLGIRATILPRVSIGKNAVVAAGSVVSNNIPDETIVKGNPATVIQRLNKSDDKQEHK